MEVTPVLVKKKKKIKHFSHSVSSSSASLTTSPASISDGLSPVGTNSSEGAADIGTSLSQLVKSKKGVKRKADTTTPSGLVLPTAPFDPTYEPVVHKAAGTLSQRRESMRQAKLLRKDLNEEEEEDEDDEYIGGDQVIVRTDVKLAEQLASRTARPADDVLTEQMNYCQDVVQELFSKKHSVGGRAW
jgi:hypothetical protein